MSRVSLRERLKGITKWKYKRRSNQTGDLLSEVKVSRAEAEWELDWGSVNRHADALHSIKLTGHMAYSSIIRKRLSEMILNSNGEPPSAQICLISPTENFFLNLTYEKSGITRRDIWPIHFIQPDSHEKKRDSLHSSPSALWFSLLVKVKDITTHKYQQCHFVCT